MDLVEETAAYLDGDGRTEARALGARRQPDVRHRNMRLTTRLMQLASWLLLHSCGEGRRDTLTQANRERPRSSSRPPIPAPKDMITNCRSNCRT